MKRLGLEPIEMKDGRPKDAYSEGSFDERRHIAAKLRELGDAYDNDGRYGLRTDTTRRSQMLIDWADLCLELADEIDPDVEDKR